MRKAPRAYTLSSLQATIAMNVTTPWGPARPEGYHSMRSRIRLAWDVFTGKADVLRWPGKQ